MLPNKGNCHSVFLLSRALRLQKQTSFSSWLNTAKSQTTFMASALDLEHVANEMLSAGLVTTEKEILIDSRLLKLSHYADHETFVCIARILFETYPPNWLLSSVTNGEATFEYIPSRDMDSLEWIGNQLTGLISEIAIPKIFQKEEELRKKLGNLGEEVVAASKRHLGAKVIHVAKISDSFGYDLESHEKNRDIFERIEVKAAVENTNHRFFISKNESEKARVYSDQWQLVQITFATSALWKTKILKEDILLSRKLSSAKVIALTDVDSIKFRWLISAEIIPSIDDWTEYLLPLPENFSIPNL